jgi:hypothetical protein
MEMSMYTAYKSYYVDTRTLSLSGPYVLSAFVISSLCFPLKDCPATPPPPRSSICSLLSSVCSSPCSPSALLHEVTAIRKALLLTFMQSAFCRPPPPYPSKVGPSLCLPFMRCWPDSSKIFVSALGFLFLGGGRGQGNWHAAENLLRTIAADALVFCISRCRRATICKALLIDHANNCTACTC